MPTFLGHTIYCVSRKKWTYISNRFFFIGRRLLWHTVCYIWNFICIRLVILHILSQRKIPSNISTIWNFICIRPVILHKHANISWTYHLLCVQEEVNVYFKQIFFYRAKTSLTYSMLYLKFYLYKTGYSSHTFAT